MSTLETFVDHVAGHAGISHDRAERVTRTVLQGLGAHLTRRQRAMISDELPSPLAHPLASGTVARPVEELVLEPGMTAGQARELVGSVCRVLAERLSRESLQTLRGALPAYLARMLEPSSPGITHHAAPGQHRSTLASGRPGSAHPVSEARPPGGQVGSVSEENPHGSTKLSSATGTLHEQLHETLAESGPGCEAPLAGRH